MTIDGNKITADEGMWLVNYETKAFGQVVYLGIYDSIDNWHEITEAEKERLEAEWGGDTNAD
jgi:hypothetical protein